MEGFSCGGVGVAGEVTQVKGTGPKAMESPVYCRN